MTGEILPFLIWRALLLKDSFSLWFIKTEELKITTLLFPEMVQLGNNKDTVRSSMRVFPLVTGVRRRIKSEGSQCLKRECDRTACGLQGNQSCGGGWGSSRPVSLKTLRDLTRGDVWGRTSRGNWSSLTTRWRRGGNVGLMVPAGSSLWMSAISLILFFKRWIRSLAVFTSACSNKERSLSSGCMWRAWNPSSWKKYNKTIFFICTGKRNGL